MKKRKLASKTKKEKLNSYYLAALASILIFIYFIIDIKNNLVFSNLDLKINSLASQITSPFVINLSKVLTSIFDPIVFIILSVIIILYFIYKKRSKEAFSFFIIILFAKVIGDVIKLIIQRVRPENALVSEVSFSFPSAHALMAVIFFGFLVYLVDLHIKSHAKKEILSGLALIGALIIGITRIILSVHWFSDVLAGFMLGLFLLFAYIIILKKDHFIK